MAEYYFDIPPFEALNDSQRAAVIDPEPVALSGGPGTGKSVVSLWRHIINHTKENPINSQLLTLTTSLAYYLKKCCQTRSRTGGLAVDSTMRWFHNNPKLVDEIILDEAQDMSVDFNKGLYKYAPKVTYGADNQQILKVDSLIAGAYNLAVCSPEQELSNIFSNEPHRLNKNYRSTQRIMLFAKQYFQECLIPAEIITGLDEKIGDFPRLIISSSQDKKNEALIDVVRQYNTAETINIGILQPFDIPIFGNHHWTAKYYHELLSANGFDCSYYGHTVYNNGGLSEMKNIHCTPFKSAKGLEFDVVLIPNIDIAFRTFKVVDWRDFFVGVTRAKSQLIMFSSTPITGISEFVETVNL